MCDRWGISTDDNDKKLTSPLPRVFLHNQVPVYHGSPVSVSILGPEVCGNVPLIVPGSEGALGLSSVPVPDLKRRPELKPPPHASLTTRISQSSQGRSVVRLWDFFSNGTVERKEPLTQSVSSRKTTHPEPLSKFSTKEEVRWGKKRREGEKRDPIQLHRRLSTLN